MTAPVLARSTFKTSRLLDFCSIRELTKQIGHDAKDWPIVVLKELMDNALDAAEEARVAPCVIIEVDPGAITIDDNGPGIPPETVADILDFATRTSSREAYVSPTRGAQGNALKTILAMGYALDGGAVGETIIESRSVAHRITFEADPIRQEPKITHIQEPSEVKTGTKITVRWPPSACSILDDAKDDFLLLAEAFGWFNPHLDLTLVWDGEQLLRWPTSEATWTKWRTSDPTSAHWYDQARLKRLIGAYIADDQDHGRQPRFVRDFIGEFRGLSGSAKKSLVLEAAGAARLTLPEFFANGSTGKLLAAMQENSRPVAPKDLGEIGEDHLAECFKANGVDLAMFEYKRVFGETNGLPFVVEAAFGYRPQADYRRRRCIVSGVNWSPGIINPFRQLGAFQSLDTILTEQRCDRNEPVIFALHLACPRISFTDHGKSAVAIDERVAGAIKSSIFTVTKKWAQQRKAEERNAAARANRIDRLRASERVTIKDAAWQVMKDAYLRASGQGTLPASARQVMYKARKFIQDVTGKKLLDDYFTQTLLPNYIVENNLDWNVVFDDPRRV